MKVAFIVSEYNPFHNGHLYQISKIRERFGNDCAVVSVMSGNFVQRGGPALLDKWDRAGSAVACGADLVIELPVIYATASAELFAYGGVAASEATGICDYLVFGSESGELEILDRIASVLNDEPEEYRTLLRTFLDEGRSYPVARSMALSEYTSDPLIPEYLAAPNNILAIEYLKAIKRLGCTRLRPYTFKREGASYNDENYDPDIRPSATAIRKIAGTAEITSAQLITALNPGMPPASLAILADRFRKGKCLTSTGVFTSDVFVRLLSAGKSELSVFAGMIEGLDNRLIDIVRSGDKNISNIEDLVQAASTRRYPRSTIRRALFSMLLGIRKTDIEMASLPGAPYYLRILGFNKRGRYLLKIMRKTANLPIITRGSDFREFPASEENRNLLRTSFLDVAATDIWTQKTNGECGRDFKTRPISFPR